MILFLLAVSGLAILGLVFFAAIWAGRESDAAALDRQRQLVDSRLQDQLDRVSQDIRLMGAGYASLLLADANTADGGIGLPSATSADTFGKIATTVFGYNAAFLITAQGDLAQRGDPDTVRRYKWVRPLLQPLIKSFETEASDRARSPGSADFTRVEMMRLEGRPSVAGVISVMGPSSGASQNRNGGEGFYLVAFRFLDGDALDRLSREQGLAGARYARAADQGADEVAFQIEATASGDPIGFIIWKPDLPGSRVIGRLVPVLSVAGLVIVGLFFALMGRLRRSLRELSASEIQSRHLSLHDVLTGLPNRALFAARFEQCLATAKTAECCAVIALIDLDKFKEVNDAYGHPVGDELLKGVVDRVSVLIDTGDTLARFGGDEFALLLPDTRKDGQSAIILCNQIIDVLSKLFYLQGGDTVVRVGCSIGLAELNDPTIAPNEVLRRADVALYEAKTRGRGRLIEYSPSLDHNVEARESLAKDLRRVLEAQKSPPTDEHARVASSVGHLEVFFQGVHCALDPSRLTGAEALVRWRHPNLGLLSPDKFIPIAEEKGMIDFLGEWVLKAAATAAADWPAHMSVAVNVSPSQIRHRDFDRRVLLILEETGLSAARLELELTEAALFNIDETAQATLTSLRSQHVRIALDDFGTGFSSLSHLIQINIDRIKIDQSFVRLLGSRAEGTAIISAILSLSKALGKETTAEGVETEGQRDFLAAAGCGDLQGFLLSRPMPVSDFRLLVRHADQIHKMISASTT